MEFRDTEQADIAGGEKKNLSFSPNQKDWKTTSAFGRINFRKDAKSTYEPPVRVGFHGYILYDILINFCYFVVPVYIVYSKIF